MAFTKPDSVNSGPGGITRWGDTGPLWGLFTETTGFIQSFHAKVSNEKAEVRDETGWTTVHGYFNTKVDGDFELIEASGDTALSVVTAPIVVTLVNIASAATPEIDSGNVVVFEQDRKPNQKNFQTTTYTYEAYLYIAAQYTYSS